MSKLVAVPITLREANEFVLNFHRHSKPTQGGLFAIGVTNNIDGLLGVAIVGKPIARMLDNGYTAEVRRTCTKEHVQKGCNSFLYAACWRAWRAMGGLKLITYTLTSESGASLRGAGWRIVGETKPAKRGSAWSSQERQRAWQPIYGQLKFRWEIQ